MSQSPPGMLGKYQIIREIARSNDIVYEAWDSELNRRVAVKELAMPTGAGQKQREERLNRFLREARAAGRLTHPNIVTIYQVDAEDDRRFIAMEYLDGRNLRQELDSVDSLSPSRAIEIAIEILKGLSYAHTNGVVHRDIKPDNIQLLESGQVKITDFGIARLTFEPNLTMDGQVFGTPSYMSPEQIHGREIDARSDLFSVGVILYEMVAGAKPFTGDSVVSITYSIMNTHPMQPAQATHSLWRIIERALDKTPSMRPASADEMKGSLEAVLAEMKSGAVVSQPQPTQSWGGVVAGPPPILVNSPPPVNHQPGQVYQQPYVPGGAPPVYAPYGTTAPPQPTGATPYNPYGQSVNLPQGVPIYYPPAPKQPLFSPEVKQFFVKFLVVLLILATITAAAVLALSSITR